MPIRVREKEEGRKRKGGRGGSLSSKQVTDIILVYEPESRE